MVAKQADDFKETQISFSRCSHRSVNTRRMSAAPIKASLISLAIAALVSGLVLAYAQSGDPANCARIREVPGGCEKNASLTRVYLDNMHKNQTVRATVRKHSQEGDEDTEYAVAEDGQLFIGCGGGGTSFAVVGCQVLKSKAEKSDEP